MRIGVIGTGRIGEFHATTLRGLDGVDELVLADAVPERAADLAARTGATAAGDVEELHRSGVDGVVIAAATSVHSRLIHQALDAGVPVFCEKPVALDIPGTRAVVEHAERSGVALQVGFMRRFDVGYRAARDAVRSGRLGWVHTLRAVTCDAAPPPPEFLSTSGGLFRDCGVHDFDALRWITGRGIVSVYARGTNRGAAYVAEAGDVDTAAALVELDDGTLATVTTSRYNGAGYDVRLEVCGCADAVFVGLDDRAPLRSAEQGVTWPCGKPYATFLERFGTAYAAELAAFVELVRSGGASPCTAAEALEAMRVAEACELSRHRGRPVRVAEVVG